MKTPATALAIALLSGPLMTACSSGMAGSGGADTPEPQAAASRADKPSTPAGKPANPPQFTPVAAADWSIDKPWVGSEVPCQDGKVMAVNCQTVSLLSYLPVSEIGGGSLNDIWGWIDSTTGREFVLAARNNGMSFVEITDPLNPRYLGNLPLHEGSNPTTWRDVKVYKNHAFIVAEGRGPGMQVFDLTQLRKVAAPPATFTETAHYANINSVHNIALNEATGFVYTVGNSRGGETCGGGLHMINVQDPANPTFVGCYAETKTGRRKTGYVHDTQCVIYQGPDTQYRGKEICFNAAETAVSVADVSDKQNPLTISIATYPNVGYTHQGWLSEDQRYFFLGDELDEPRQKFNTRTMVFDMQDLDDPVLLTEFYGTTKATDHNMYVRGNYIYQSNYAAGLRILDSSDPMNLKEVGYLHSPKGSSWSNFPYFNDNVVAFTSGRQGLFMVRFDPTKIQPPTPQ